MSNGLIVRSNFNDIYLDLLRKLYTEGQGITNKNGEGLSEAINFSFELTDPRRCFATCRNMSLTYLKGELEFYLSGSPLLEDIAKHSKFWERCTDDGKTINSNYGKLLFYDVNSKGQTQFEYARDMLLRNSDSKKAVMTIYSPENAYESNDNPCTMYLQFFIRDNAISLYVKMRSSDIWFGLPYDVPFFVMVLFMMREALATRGRFYEIGVYNHNSGSLHLYQRNREKALEVLNMSTTIDCHEEYNLFDKYIWLPLIRLESSIKPGEFIWQKEL